MFGSQLFLPYFVWRLREGVSFFCGSSRRVGCSAMHRLVLLLAVLSAIAPQTNFTNIDESPTTTITMPPTVFKNPQRAVTPRRAKGESPMLNYIFDSYAANNRHFHDKFSSPSFDDDNSSESNIEAYTGATVFFNCRISSLRDKLVSWVKVSEVSTEMELLTIDLNTHTSDNRYRVDLGGENWRLILREVKVQDSGVYCCHVSTHPPLLKHVKLTVYPPEIKLTTEVFVETSETLSLKCMILYLDPGDTKPELHWYKGNSTVSLDELRGGVFIETDLNNLTSHLQVALLKMEDAGNYTCSLEAPLRMTAVARVHVLQGSSLAELQSGVKVTTSYSSLLMVSLLLVFGANVDIR
ncbi:uncharacterized protein LOC113239509 [Hyposmocoma kahamanoa]|uniref:uncharacterized protein LOC113239509 n=1 Tax=Hyposmocoma kahamanoa TaxID=1477025 RepID=UPI000E6D7C98|nr:uncharacterized protein LOC113239509 [Hyposmocoma kahamanoa]